jgi:diguanylate cyclase (GGDEF)-like protein
MKYSLAIIYLDNYSHLYKVFGYFKSTKILKMLANRLKELEAENPIYSYNIGEFIIIFKNDNLKQSFEKLDNIRREIASSEFMISNKQKGIKITISGCISEKKRSDNNATEVLVRARKALQKSYQFTQNLISKA